MHFKAPDIGLDLGTCNTVVYVKNEGIVISEPTLVISRRGDKKPIAVGEDAQRMYGRTSDAEIAIHPIRNGMIANYDATVLLLRAFISKAVGESNLVKPRLVMSIPSEIDEVNRKALTAAVRACGLKKVYLIEKPLAAAIGAGLSVFEPEGCMVVDVGGGTTEVAVVSLGGLTLLPPCRRRTGRVCASAGATCSPPARWKSTIPRSRRTARFASHAGRF
mgnify:CR=1 FL=1